MSQKSSKSDGKALAAILHRFAKELDTLKFSGPVACVYNPLDYAREPCDQYCERYGGAGKKLIFLGMNPGPFGMAQTGVPFGEVATVKDWLGISGHVSQPRVIHPKRPILGFACKRSEVSGTRLWGQIRARFVTPERFFKIGFIVNYCPLLFYDRDGKNLTPDKLIAVDRMKLTKVCDKYLAEQVDALTPKWVIGVGKYAADQAARALGGGAFHIAHVLHPSPASPAANRGWAAQFEKQLHLAGVPWPS